MSLRSYRILMGTRRVRIERRQCLQNLSTTQILAWNRASNSGEATNWDYHIQRLMSLQGLADGAI